MHRNIPFITLEQQPDFPDRDLSDANAEIIGEYYLPNTEAIRLEAERLEESARPLFSMVLGFLALKGTHMTLEDAPDAYKGFTTGFASYEFIQLLVTRAPYDIGKAALRMQALYADDAQSWMTKAISFSERAAAWPDRRPNVYAAVIKQGFATNASLQNIEARSIGAQVAFELQQPLLDRP